MNKLITKSMFSSSAIDCFFFETSYFRPPADYDGQSMADDEALMDSDQARFIWVHSGWVDHAHFDPLRNFADRGSDVYLRRELNSWTDSVKLRYGSCRSDCPELWDRARDYAKVTARVFHGIRLDNCHSTSLAVAEHVLNAARSVRPDLYVFAELFTGSGQQTIRHANRLGLNAVIEGALDLSQPKQLAEKIMLAGGLPLGAYVCRTVGPLVPGRLPVMFFDQTHDDPSPLDRRSAYDLLPTSALIAASASAAGSNRGYDEVIPRRISVISETRLYRTWDSSENGTNAASSAPAAGSERSSPTTKGKVEVQEFVNFDTGIVRAKKALNDLHYALAANGYEQIGLEVLSDDIIAMMRYSSKKHHACVVVAHSAFQQTGYQCRPIRPLEIPGVVSRIILEASVVCRSLQFRQHPELIVGLPNYAVHMQENIDHANSAMVLVRPSTVTPGFQAVDFKSFKPGCVVAFDVALSPESESAVRSLDQLVVCFDRLIWDVPQQLTEVSALKQASVERLKTIIAEPNLKELPESETPRKFEGDFEFSSGEAFDELSSSGTSVFSEVLKIVSYLSSDDSHFVLYEAPDEKYSVYHIPGYGDLGHCGLAGLATAFDEIHQSGADPVRHPLGRNLCSGDWLMDYVSDRLVANSRTTALGEWFRKIFNVVKKLPRFLVPRYFEAVTTGVFSLASVQI